MWYKKYEHLYLNEKNQVMRQYPKLNYYIENKKIIISGELDIKDKNNIVWDTFKILIVFPDDYPNSLPKTFEINRKIPRYPSRHINYDGSCCLCVRTLEKKYFQNGITITDYIEKLVIPFLANQIWYEKKGEWVNGDYSHGTQGILEAYEEITETKDINTILKIIEYVINAKKIQINKKCFCESGKKLKKCHLNIVNKLRNMVNKKVLIEDYHDLKRLKDI